MGKTVVEAAAAVEAGVAGPAEAVREVAAPRAATERRPSRLRLAG